MSNQQVDIELSGNGWRRPSKRPSPRATALRTLPAAGTDNNDHNPDRVKARNLFDLAWEPTTCSARKPIPVDVQWNAVRAAASVSDVDRLLLCGANGDS
jgi:hypothetical protein